MTLAVIAILGLSLEPAIGNRIGQEHLPNLRTRRPIGLEITHENGAKLLRFTNTVANVGAGPLEMRPDNSDGTTTDAYQRVYTHNNSMTWQFMYERLVGTFVFHPQHNHWHFESFAAYELHAVATHGSVGSIVAQGQD